MKTKEKAVIKQSIIPELVSGSSTQAVTQQQALKTLKKFQGLSYFISEHSFTHRAYRLGVSPTGAASKLWDTCHKNGDLSGSHPTYKLTYKEEALNKGSFRAPLRSGFTLIELLVVVLIIGILAAVALPQYQKAVLKSRAVQAFTLGKYLQEQEELYYLAHGAYTNNFKELGAEIPQGFSLGTTGTRLSFPKGTGSFTLLENYNRILFQNYRPMYAISFNLGTGSSPKFVCTAYQNDNYKAKALCQSLSGKHTDGKSECMGICTSWYF